MHISLFDLSTFVYVKYGSRDSHYVAIFFCQNYPLNSKTIVNTTIHIVLSCFVLLQLVVGHRKGKELLTLSVTKKKKKKA
jgi:hypothetical protein